MICLGALGSLAVFQDFSMPLDWPVENAIVQLANRVVGNLKHRSGNSLRQVGIQINDLGTALRMLLPPTPPLSQH